jgi:serine/threonine protein kinase
MNDLYFRSPEMIAGNYGTKCDIWALGAMMHLLITGVPPFCGATDDIIKDNIQNQKLSLNNPIWNAVSHECKDLV